MRTPFSSASSRGASSRLSAPRGSGGVSRPRSISSVTDASTSRSRRSFPPRPRMSEPGPVARVLERRARADYGGAREEALRALDELDARSDAGDLFELLLELGRLQHDCGEAAEAESTFENALAVGGNEAVRARALARLSAL